MGAADLAQDEDAGGPLAPLTGASDPLPPTPTETTPHTSSSSLQPFVEECGGIPDKDSPRASGRI